MDYVHLGWQIQFRTYLLLCVITNCAFPDNELNAQFHSFCIISVVCVFSSAGEFNILFSNMGNYKVETFLHNYCTNTGDFHSSSNGGRSATTRREASARGQRVCCLSDVDLRIERWCGDDAARALSS